MSKPKRQKTSTPQRSLDHFFNRPIRCLCRGSVHLGDLNGGGKQCSCISLSFLVSSSIPKSTRELDGLLETGTTLYHTICKHGGYLLPNRISLPDNDFSIETKEPFNGMLRQSTDNTDALTFTYESALKKGFSVSNSCFFTIGNDPGYTIGIRRHGDDFVVIDSHSRNDHGLSSAEGKAIVLTVPSYNELNRYVKEMAGSLFERDVPFEVTPLIYSRIEANNSTDDQPNTANVQEIQNYVLNPQNSNEQQQLVDDPEPQNSNDDPEPHNSNFDPELPNSNDGPELPNSNVDPEFPNSDDDPDMQYSMTNDDPDPQNANFAELEHSSISDISHIDPNTCPIDLKYALINSRIPEIGFKIPPRSYTDKRCKYGSFMRNFKRDWFTMFDFICYSKKQKGIYCLACVLFPDNSHRRPKKLITEPYNNWKDAVEDLGKHSLHDYHRNSKAKYDAFLKTSEDQSQRIDAMMNTGSSILIQKNRAILTSILKCLEFCGRRGIALRGHRDDETQGDDRDHNMGNFKELIKFRIDLGDTVLEDHLKKCPKNASYISKTTQNELLLCIKMYIQNKIIEDVKKQTFGPFFGYQCDEVRNSSNWEQLGLVLRYVSNGKPVERLLEFIQTEDVSGESLCQHIIKSLTDAGLDVKNCRSQTMDGAGNMSGKNVGCATRFSKESPRAVYHYCTSHDLSLVLCKSCTISEIHIMLDTLKKLGIFFTYSPKRSRRLERCVEEYNGGKPKADKITKTKFKIFCETRWTEKHSTLENFYDMYKPLINCLEAIAKLERGWDRKAVTDANGLLTQMKDPTFIFSFVVVHHFFGYVKGVSRKLQGSHLDIVQGFRMVESVRSVITNTRNDDIVYNTVFESASKLSTISGRESLSIPRRCERQIHRNNVPANTPKDYYRRAIYLPFLDMMIQQLNLRFSSLSSRVAQALHLIPSGIDGVEMDTVQEIFDYFKEDLPSPAIFMQEFQIWKTLWQDKTDKPDDLTSTVSDPSCCSMVFLNITKILYLLMLTSVTSSSVERANSSLKFTKNPMRSTMNEDRLNALLLLYVHRDIAIDYNSILDTFARRNPRKMLLRNPLE